jgi:hypothetical protein
MKVRKIERGVRHFHDTLSIVPSTYPFACDQHVSRGAKRSWGWNNISGTYFNINDLPAQLGLEGLWPTNFPGQAMSQSQGLALAQAWLGTEEVEIL